MKRKDTGALVEKLAAGFLKKRGYKIIGTNYRCARGEIDIIAKHKGSLVFIEVRSKADLRFGSPEESITFTKMRHLRASALYYIQSHSARSDSSERASSLRPRSGQAHNDVEQKWRIDVVAIELDEKGKASRIELIENAVGEE